MTRVTYETGFIIRGDASDATQALQSTQQGLNDVRDAQDRATRTARTYAQAVNEAEQASLSFGGAVEFAVAALGGFSLGAVIKETAELGAESAAAARYLGVTTEALTSMQYAAGKVKVESEEFTDILGDMTEKIGEYAATGGGGALDFFELLNEDVNEFIGLSADQQLIKVGEALSKVQDQGQKVFILESLASNAKKLIPLLDNGAEGLKRFSAEAINSGYALTALEAERLEEIDRAINNVNSSLATAGQNIAVQLAEPITAAANEINVFLGDADAMEVALDNITTAAEITAAVVGFKMIRSVTEYAVAQGRAVAASYQAAAAERAHAAALQENAVRTEAIAANTARASEQRAAQEVSRLRTVQAQYQRNIQATISAERMLAAQHQQTAAVTQQRAAATQRINAMRQQQTVVTRQLVQAEAHLTAAQGAATGAASRHTAALATQSAVARAGTVVMRGFSSALALVGGPVGLLALAATAAAVTAVSYEGLEGQAKRAASAQETLNRALDPLSGITKTEIGEAVEQTKNKISELATVLEVTKDKISIAEKVDRGPAAELETLKQKSQELQQQLGVEEDALERLEAAIVKVTKAEKEAADQKEEFYRKRKEEEELEARKRAAEAVAAAAGKEVEALKALHRQLDPTYAKYQDFTEAKALLERAFEKGGITVSRYADMMALLVNEYNESGKATDKAIEKADELIKSMEREIELLGLSARDRYIETQARKAEAGATGEQIAKIRELAAQQYDAQQQSKSYTEANKTAARETESAWSGVSDAFSGMWGDALDDFDEFADSLQGRIKNLALDTAFEQLTGVFTANTSNVPGVSSSVQGPPTQAAFNASQQGSGIGAAGALSGLGIYGMVAAAVVAGVSELNDKQDDRFREYTAEYKQSAQFTGTILGDVDAKSESIRRGIDEIAGYSAGVLDVNNAMLQALESMAYGIGELSKSFQIEFARNPIETHEFAARHTSGGNFMADTEQFFSRTPLASIANMLTDGLVFDFGDAVIDAVTKLFSKKKRSIIDSGVQLIGADLAEIYQTASVDAFQYAIEQVTRWTVGISRKGPPVRLPEEPIDGPIEQQLGKLFNDAGKAIEVAVEGLGLDIEQSVISALSFETIDISLKDKSDEEVTKAFEQFFSSTLDAWAEEILIAGEGFEIGIDSLELLARHNADYANQMNTVSQGTQLHSQLLLSYQEAGEGAFETLIRLSAETQQVTHWADILNLRYDAQGLAVIDLVQNLADVSGGFDVLNTHLGVYYSKFFTEQERQNDQHESLLRVFGELGQVLPATRDGFRALVESLEIDPDASPDLVAQLISLSGAADQFYTTQEARLNELTQIYEEQLGRAPDATGLQNYMDLLASGAVTMDQVAIAVGSSAEAITNHINDVYDEILGREPDTGGFQYYFDLIDQGTLKFGELAEVIKNSAEATVQKLKIPEDNFVGPRQDPNRIQAGELTSTLARDLKLSGLDGLDRDQFQLDEWLSETLANIATFSKKSIDMTEAISLATEIHANKSKELLDKYDTSEPLRNLLAGFRETLDTVDMSDYERAVYNLNKETQSAIKEANELQAGEGELSVIRRASAVQLREIQAAERARVNAITETYTEKLAKINMTDFEVALYDLDKEIQNAILSTKGLENAEEAITAIRAYGVAERERLEDEEQDRVNQIRRDGAKERERIAEEEAANLKRLAEQNAQLFKSRNDTFDALVNPAQDDIDQALSTIQGKWDDFLQATSDLKSAPDFVADGQLRFEVDPDKGFVKSAAEFRKQDRIDELMDRRADRLDEFDRQLGFALWKEEQFFEDYGRVTTKHSDAVRREYDDLLDGGELGLDTIQQKGQEAFDSVINGNFSDSKLAQAWDATQTQSADVFSNAISDLIDPINEELIRANLTPLQAALRDLDQEFEPLIERGKRLGLTHEQLAPLYDLHAIKADNLRDKMSDTVDAAESLANALDTAFGGLKEAVDAEREVYRAAYEQDIDDIRSHYADLTDGLKDRMSGVNEAVRELGSLASTLDSAVRATTDRTSDIAQQQARSELVSALAIAQAGGSLRSLDISEAIDVISQASARSTDQFNDQYEQNVNRVLLKNLSKEAGNQLSIEEQTFDALERQIEATQAASEQELSQRQNQFEAQEAYFDQVLEDAQAEINALNAIDGSVLSVRDALVEFGGALTNSQALAAKNASYQSHVDNGTDYAPDRYVGRDYQAPDVATFTVPGFASGGDHYGGWHWVGEDGPELRFSGPSHYVSNGDSRRLLDNRDLVAEIRALREDLRTLQRGANTLNTQDAQKTHRLLTRIVKYGIPQA